MAKFHVDESDPNLVYFQCSGCGEPHALSVNGEVGADGISYLWNGDVNSPTIDNEVVKHMSAANICHAQIVAAQITYFADSWHSLAGQTVTIPDWQPGEASIYDN